MPAILAELPNFGFATDEANRSFLLGLILLGIILVLFLLGWMKHKGIILL